MKIMHFTNSNESFDTKDLRELSKQINEAQLYVQEEDHEQVALTEKIHEASQVANTINTINNVLADSNVVLGNAEARVIDIAVEHFCKRLGYQKTSSISMEAYAASPSRKEKIRASMEGIGDLISAIWQAIKSAFNKVFEWISSIFKAIFGAKDKISTKAKIVTQDCKVLEDKVEAAAKDPKTKKNAETLERLGSAKTLDEFDAMMESAQVNNNGLKDEKLRNYFRKPDGTDIFSLNEIVINATLLNKSTEEFFNGKDSISDTIGQLKKVKAAFANPEKISVEEETALIEETDKSILELYDVDKFFLLLTDKSGNAVKRFPFNQTLVVSDLPKAGDSGSATVSVTAELWPALSNKDAILHLSPPEINKKMADGILGVLKDKKIEKKIDTLEDEMRQVLVLCEEIFKQINDEEKAKKFSNIVHRYRFDFIYVINTLKLVVANTVESANMILKYIEASNAITENVIKS